MATHETCSVGLCGFISRSSACLILVGGGAEEEAIVGRIGWSGLKALEVNRRHESPRISFTPNTHHHQSDHICPNLSETVQRALVVEHVSIRYFAVARGKFELRVWLLASSPSWPPPVRSADSNLARILSTDDPHPTVATRSDTLPRSYIAQGSKTSGSSPSQSTLTRPLSHAHPRTRLILAVSARYDLSNSNNATRPRLQAT